MFERYTDSARRVVFFARYEASQTNCETIEPAHILLGLIREERSLLHCFLSQEATADIEVDARKLVMRTTHVPTSAELPLSNAAAEVLRHAGEQPSESVRVYPVDLLIGLLRERESGTSQILLRRGITLEEVRKRSADLRVGQPSTGPIHEVKRTMPGPADWAISINRQGYPPWFISKRQLILSSLAILVALTAIVIIAMLLLRR